MIRRSAEPGIGEVEGAGMVAAESARTWRLQGFDDGQPGFYFVTICTKGRYPWFGAIEAGGMSRSESGEIAAACWRAIPGHFPDVELDRCGSSGANRSGPQSRNLSSIVRGFKIGVTKSARAIDPSFGWQPRFWDRVVRDWNEVLPIRGYILTNECHHGSHPSSEAAP